ncbi:MAG: transposase [Alphaproteobacteria bacterium]|nr:transposase [Alphaproteobacteria bacterium]
MSLAWADLPSDPEALRVFALACQNEQAAATAELQAAKLAIQLRTLEIEKLKFQIAKLRRMQFGRSSDRITRQIEQLELRLEDLEAARGRRTQQGRGKRSCMSRPRMAPAPVPPAAAPWPSSATTSRRCWTTFPAASG